MDTKVHGCSCQLCNPTFVDAPAPPITQDPDNDTEWSIVSGKLKDVRFKGEVVAKATADLSRN